MKQHYFDVPFAFSGDVTAIPDPLQTGGTVSFTEGWNYNYQRNLATDPAALPIDRSTMNWLLLQITTALQQLQQNSTPEFILASQNGGAAFPYPAQAEVLWSASGNAPFVRYVNISGTTNTNAPSADDPTGATTGWSVTCDPIATAAQASAGTNNASIITPLLLAQQTALRALLAGNSSQVFNVANATSNTHAVPLGQLEAMAPLIGRGTNISGYATGSAKTFSLNSCDEFVVGTALGGLLYKLINLGGITALNIGNVGANGIDTGSAPINGFVAVYVIYNPTSQTVALLARTITTPAATIYAGANMPGGFTASGLIAILKTDGSGNIVTTRLTDRAHTINSVNVLNVSTSTSVGSYTALSLAGVVPPNTRYVVGNGSVGASNNAYNYLTAAGDSTGTGAAFLSGYNNFGSQYRIPIVIGTSNMYYTYSVAAAGTVTFTISVTGYEI